MRRIYGYIGIVALCLLYWILDSVWSYLSFEINLNNLIFREPASYVDTFLLKVPPYQIVSRLMVVALFILSGVIIIEFIKKRQTAEQERKASHDTFLTVLNSIDATVYVADMKTHEILFMNQYMIDKFDGDFSGEICHKSFRNSAEMCDHCVVDDLVDEFGNPKGLHVWEGYNSVADGWFLNYDRAIKWIDGRIVHLQIATDITQLKRLQEQQAEAELRFLQGQKMEAIGTLAGGIAHDFNNILAAIIGYSELALDNSDREAEVKEYMVEVLKASNRAKDLVQQILVFARQSGKTRKPIQVGSIVKEVLKFIRSSIPTTIEIRSDIQSTSLIMGDATQMYQVVLNLCTNAAQAMENTGGTLHVSLRDMAINPSKISLSKSLPAGEYLHLTVSDTGIGISTENIDSIFEPYFTTKASGEGTGLGLAMVHGIVESYGGKIEVDSAPNKGTMFNLFFPVSKKLDFVETVQSDTLPRGRERILFVDDEVSIADTNRRLLEQLGYSVSSHTSSLEALDYFNANAETIDLVITDMTMPNMTGEELAKEMLAIRPDLPIVLCTGFSKKIDNEKAQRIGIRTLLKKPFLKDELATTIREALNILN